MRFQQYRDQAVFLLRIALGGIFLWFGVTAVLDPSSQLFWLASWIRDIPFVGTTAFISVFGVFEILVGLALLLGVFPRFASLLAAAALLGIVVNLGWGEIAFRDAVLFFASLVLASQERHRWSLYQTA